MAAKTKPTGIDRFGNPDKPPKVDPAEVGQDPSAEAAAKRAEASIARAHRKGR